MSPSLWTNLTMRVAYMAYGCSIWPNLTFQIWVGSTICNGRFFAWLNQGDFFEEKKHMRRNYSSHIFCATFFWVMWHLPHKYRLDKSMVKHYPQELMWGYISEPEYQLHWCCSSSFQLASLSWSIHNRYISHCNSRLKWLLNATKESWEMGE